MILIIMIIDNYIQMSQQKWTIKIMKKREDK